MATETPEDLAGEAAAAGVSTTLMDTFRSAVEDEPELAAFRTAYAAFDAASRADKGGYWQAAFDDAQAGMSPAYRLKRAIRGVVASLGGSLTPLGREAAYRALAAQYVPEVPPPAPAEQEAVALQQLLIQELLS